MPTELADDPPSDAAIAAAYATLFDGLDQLGPGTARTRDSLIARLAGQLAEAPTIADMGAGTGAASLGLASAWPRARVIAIDNHPGFVARLRERARGLPIEAVIGDMAAPPLEPESLDLVWCEAAIYGIGRAAALEAWRPLLAPGGLIVFSDVVWQEPEPPEAASIFWAREYPAMTTVAGVAAEIAEAGFALDLIEAAPGSDWQAYYAPLRERVTTLDANADTALALVLAAMRREIAVFDRAGESYASVWFVLHAAR